MITIDKTTRILAHGAVLALLAVSLGGCLVLSVHPIHTPETLHADDGLIGLWGVPEDPDGETWRFEAGDDGAYVLTVREAASEPGAPRNEGRFIVHLVGLDDRIYMDLFPDEPAEGNDFYMGHVLPTHSIWRFERQGHVLTLGLLSPEALAALRDEAGVSVDQVETEGVTVLTAGTEDLQALLVAHGADLFPETDQLNRIR